MFNFTVAHLQICPKLFRNKLLIISILEYCSSLKFIIYKQKHSEVHDSVFFLHFSGYIEWIFHFNIIF